MCSVYICLECCYTLLYWYMALPWTLIELADMLFVSMHVSMGVLVYSLFIGWFTIHSKEGQSASACDCLPLPCRAPL